MRIRLTFKDRDSEAELIVAPNGIQFRRPSKGMTSNLRALANAVAKALGDEDVTKFVEESEDIQVLVGEERCG